jgi:5-methylcytosine-specific restriction endonuclease McrA
MSNRLLRSRQLAFDRQGGRCFYCGVLMWQGAASGLPGLRCTAEHLVPRGEGGTDRPDNIVAACAHCNATRHKRKKPPTPTLYRAQVQRRVSQGRWHPPSVHRARLLRTHSDSAFGGLPQVLTP